MNPYRAEARQNFGAISLNASRSEPVTHGVGSVSTVKTRRRSCSARPAKRRIVEHSEIFLDRAPGRTGRQTRSTFDAGAVAGVGLDQTGIDGKAIAADQALPDERCSTLSNSRRRAEAAGPVFQGRVIRHRRQKIRFRAAIMAVSFLNLNGRSSMEKGGSPSKTHLDTDVWALIVRQTNLRT
jgi:hypothetical protein